MEWNRQNGRLLQSARDEKGLTQYALARRANIQPPTFIQEIESGNKKPDETELYNIAAVLRVSMDWLLGKEGAKKYLTDEDLALMLKLHDDPDDPDDPDEEIRVEDKAAPPDKAEKAIQAERTENETSPDMAAVKNGEEQDEKKPDADGEIKCVPDMIMGRTLGERLTYARENKEMLQRDVMNALPRCIWSISVLSGYENDRAIPPYNTLLALCVLYGVRPEQLADRKELEEISKKRAPENFRMIMGNSIGERLRNRREALSMTAKQASAKFPGYMNDKSTLTRYENGNRVVPYDTLLAICVEYEVYPDQLGTEDELNESRKKKKVGGYRRRRRAAAQKAHTEERPAEDEAVSMSERKTVDDPNIQFIGEALQKARSAADLTVGQAAQKAGIAESRYTEIESGMYEINLSELIAVSEAVMLDVTDVLSSVCPRKWLAYNISEKRDYYCLKGISCELGIPFRDSEDLSEVSIWVTGKQNEEFVKKAKEVGVRLVQQTYAQNVF